MPRGLGWPTILGVPAVLADVFDASLCPRNAAAAASASCVLHLAREIDGGSAAKAEKAEHLSPKFRQAES